jgi:cobalt/nickel transport system permease protein
MKLLTIGNTAGYDTFDLFNFGRSVGFWLGDVMHIPDGVLSTPTTVVADVLAFGGLALFVSKLRKREGEKTVILMGTMAAFVFAAQMVNFTLVPFPISGHLLGGVLSSVMLGPWAGPLVISLVLIVQCFLAADGGLLALGANFLNMGVIGGMVGYAIYVPIRRAIGGRTGILLGAMAAAWFSVILAAAAFSLEFAASGNMGMFLTTLGWMVLVHAGIGLGEAIITGLVVRFVLVVRPDLIYDPDTEAVAGPTRKRIQVVLGGLAIAAAIAVFLAPLASSYDDGLEYVGGKLHFIGENEAGPVVRAPLPDYEMPGLEHAKGLATAAAGLVGTLVVFGSGLGLARVFLKSDGLGRKEKVELDVS